MLKISDVDKAAKLSFFTHSDTNPTFAEFTEVKLPKNLDLPVVFSHYKPGSWIILIYNGDTTDVEFTITLSLLGNHFHYLFSLSISYQSL